MVTRTERLSDFTTDADPAPDSLVEVLCEDHVGTYLLPFLCRTTPDNFRNERTGAQTCSNGVTLKSRIVPSRPGLAQA